MKAKKWQLVLGLLLCLGGLLWAVIALGAPSGAIFTTNSLGNVVDMNIYPSKTAVFLNGGPPPNAPCSAAGLPDANYYFQVTNPSGSLLLSAINNTTPESIAERKFTVSGGLITAYLGTTHATGTGKCPGAISVGLAPFNDTDNEGGEYKVWVTPVGSYVPFGYDKDGNPIFDENGNPKWDPRTVFGFLPSNSKTDNFKVRLVVPPGGLVRVTITGFKFYDYAIPTGSYTSANQTDGIWQNPPEPPIPGWKIVLTKPNGDTEVDYTDTVTPTTGQYSFQFLVDTTPPFEPITYTISEVFPGPSWKPTTVTSGTVTFDGSSTNLIGPTFGNVCLGGGGGLTLGFWSNKNGQAKMTNGPGAMAGALAFLSGLNLKNADGTDFNPTTYNGSPASTAFRPWLLSANATNMAYMLSAQLAAMELNVRQGCVDGTRLIYAPGTTSANPAGFATVNAIMNEANAELGLHGTAYAGDAWRSYQETLKNALDNANNNTTFVQSFPCDFITPY